MNTNFVICRNEVLIEGVNVGQFESFEYEQNSRTLGSSGVLVLPLYAIGATGDTSGVAATRVRKEFVTSHDKNIAGLIKPCAYVEVWCWYDTWDPKKDGVVSQNKEKMFSGFITTVEEGYPARIHIQDNAFILRFGATSTVFNGEYTVQDVVEKVIPVAQEAFDKERESYDLTYSIPRLTYTTEKQNVQAFTTLIQFANFGDQSPFNIIRRIMQANCLYGGVDEDFNVFVGSGVEKSNRPLFELSTAVNVIERHIVPVDGRFVDYDVKIVGILENGRKYTATAGLSTSKSVQKKSELEKKYAQSFKAYSPLKTVKELNAFADTMLANLRGTRNKGRITCLLYPRMRVMDWVTYTDTVFENLSSGLYVLGYRFIANSSGYFQHLEVSDQVFML